MLVSILIVSYNTRDLTLACLRSVFEQTPPQLAFEVIVLDNASSDASADAIAEQFPQVRLIRSAENLGFARGNNVAAQEANGTYLLLLNPDTEILDDAIGKAVAFSQGLSKATVVGGRTFFPDGTLNYESCHGRPTVWSLFCMGTGLSVLFRRSRWFDPESLGQWARDSVREVDSISGCFMLIPRDLWVRLRGFDESYFMYGEDTDICLRAWRMDVPCVICPQAALIHHGGASEPVRADKMVRLFRAKRQLIEKHWTPSLARLGGRLLVLWAGTRALAFRLLSRAHPRFRASAEAWGGVWRRRLEYTNSDAAMF